MTIIKTKQAGFCFGVKRAVQLAEEILENARTPVFSLGPLMHNSLEVKRLSKKGLIVRNSIQDCVGGVTLVRTHGILREEWELSQKLGIELADAICPHVIHSKTKLEQFGREGRTVFLVGDPGHPEVQALLSWAVGPIYLLSRSNDVPFLDPATSIGILAQTTQSHRFFSEMVSLVSKRYQNVDAATTICKDAGQRQQDGMSLSKQVDLVVVVGGKNSANTCRLAEICRTIQPRTIHIESAQELCGISLSGIEKVGLISGASTPDWIIEEIETRLSKNPG